MNEYKTPRYELIRDYHEKCAAMEEDMLGWKERAIAAEAKLAEAEKENAATHRHAVRLLEALHPGLLKSRTTIGIIDQIDNATAGGGAGRASRREAPFDASPRQKHR